MANNGLLPGGTPPYLDFEYPNSPSYGVVGGIPTIVIQGTPLKGLSTWDHIVAGYRRMTGTLFAPFADSNTTLTPDERNKTPSPGDPAGMMAPLLAIALAAAAAYVIWKGAK